jgi:hypothetical protein
VIPSQWSGSGLASPSNRLDNLRNRGKISETALKHQAARKKYFDQNQTRSADRLLYPFDFNSSLAREQRNVTRLRKIVQMTGSRISRDTRGSGRNAKGLA